MGLVDQIQRATQKAQTQGMQGAMGSAEQGLQDIIEMLRPEVEMRQRAMVGYEDILSGKTDITQRAGYEAGLRTGTQGIERSAAARGMQLSGTNLEDLASFGTQYYQQQRQQALSELGGLAGLSAPSLQATTGAMGEIASLPMQQMQMELAAKQGEAASRAGMLGGIGSVLGGIGMLAMASDRRMKENITYIGNKHGLSLYEFNYKPQFKDNAGYGRYRGVMAQDIKTDYPEAIITHPSGYMFVDYSKLPVKMVEV